jgi:(S)-ureidoglycine aminohydrolase
MGARFMQYTVILEPGAASASPGAGVERFCFVHEGAVSLDLAGKQHELDEGGFAFIPADTEHRLTTDRGSSPARLTIFEKLYQPGASKPPAPVVGNERTIKGDIYQGDPALSLQVLLPVEPAFDLAVNLFTYQPGGHLPQVEIHGMEHGLIMLAGGGVYRLGDDWFPVQGGDVIWMASYCPQWFTAMGKTPAKYLYYKDIHRDRLTEKLH